MSQIRYFVMPLQDRWTIRRDCRRVGAFIDEVHAMAAVVQLASVDRVRGHLVRVLKQDEDGRWTPCDPRAG